MILIIGLWLSFIVMCLLSIGTFIECVTGEFSLMELLILIGVIIATVIVGFVLFAGGYNLP